MYILKSLLLVCCLTLVSFTQQDPSFREEFIQSLDPKVIDFYGQDQINHYMDVNPGFLLYRNCLLKYAYSVQDYGQKALMGGYEKLQLKDRLGNGDNTKFNELNYKISLKPVKQVFWIEGSKVLVVAPKDEFLEKYNVERKKWLN